MRIRDVACHPAAWLAAAVVLGAAGSWTAFETPGGQVAENFEPRRGEPTLSVDEGPAAYTTLGPPAGGTRSPSPEARAVFLDVEPADARTLERGIIQSAHWDSLSGPAWLTGTIEEIKD